MHSFVLKLELGFCSFTTDSIGAEQLSWVKLMTAFVISSDIFSQTIQIFLIFKRRVCRQSNVSY